MQLKKGGRGIFEIRLDGRVVFAKSSAGRFPTPADLAALPVA